MNMGAFRHTCFLRVKERLMGCPRGGNRETDAEIAGAFGASVATTGWRYRNAWWESFMTPGYWYSLPHYTAELPAAIKLVERVAPQVSWSVTGGVGSSHFACIDAGVGIGRATARAATPEIALLCALVDAVLQGFVSPDPASGRD